MRVRVQCLCVVALFGGFFTLFLVCSFSLFYYSVGDCLCVSKKSMYPHINSYYTHFMTSFYVFSVVVVVLFLSTMCLFHLLCFDLCLNINGRFSERCQLKENQIIASKYACQANKIKLRRILRKFSIDFNEFTAP